MDEFKALIHGKRITLMGLGLLGRGAGDAAFLSECGAHVLVTDKKTSNELAESVDKLRGYKNIAFRLGEHRESDFTDCDMVIKAAGVPLNSPFIKTAQDAGVPIHMSTALFAKYTPATVVGVTGTRGKSTVTQLIYEGLIHAGRRAHLGGNVRGVATLPMLPETKKGDMAVLELDSWQLQGFGYLGISPNVAVFTNLMQDHLNYYATIEEYFSDKAHIFLHQKDGDTLVVGESIFARIESVHPTIPPYVPDSIPASWHLHMLGEHNRENASLALGVLEALSVSQDVARESIERFPGVPGRLELVATVNDVPIYNDGNATTPDAALAALRSFPEKHVVMIMGGTDKKIPIDALVAEIQMRGASIVLLDESATGTQKCKEIFFNAPMCNSVTDALKEALLLTREDSVVVLSPGFSSFGILKNEYDRGDQFRDAAQSLEKTPR